MYREAPRSIPQKLCVCYWHFIVQDPDSGIVFSQMIARYLLAPVRHLRATQCQNGY